MLGKRTGWPMLHCPTFFDGYLPGLCRETKVSEIIKTGLPFGEWLAQKDVFSYAFTYKNRLNYTCM